MTPKDQGIPVKDEPACACSSSGATVIIPHYNDPIRLERCLAALMPQVRVCPEVDVVVVDNASNPPLSEELTGRFGEILFVNEMERGAAIARNRGVNATRSERLFFLDADCVPDSDWLVTALRVSDRAPLVGGQVSVFDETLPPRSGAQAFEAVFAFDNQRYVESVGFSVTANLLTRRSVFERVGGFRAGVPEDLDWCRRATAAGFTLVFSEELKVSHPSRADWVSLKLKWRRLVDEAWEMSRRESFARLFWALKGLAMPVSAFWDVPRVIRHKRLRSWLEKRRALGILFLLRFSRMIWMLRQAFGST